MVIVIAIIFGAHLLPFGWLYKSKVYIVAAVLIPVLSLAIGINFDAYIVAAVMLAIEVIFSISLVIENKTLYTK